MTALTTIHLASALITDSNNRMLTVRKKGSEYYMMAGGKIEKGEKPIQALIRELQEELAVQINEKDISLLGSHQTNAVNETNTIVSATIFHIIINDSHIVASSEIEEIKWLTHENFKDFKLAHLLQEFSLPIWLKLK